MDIKFKILWGAVSVALVIAIGAYFFPQKAAQIIEKTEEEILGSSRFLFGISVGTSTAQARGEFVAYGTSTIFASFDGYMAGGRFTFGTTSAQILHRNINGRAVCDGNNGILHIRTNNSFSPAFVVSVGTSTASRSTRNLIASTTIATTSPGTIEQHFGNSINPFAASQPATSSMFAYNPGDQIIVMVGDVVGANDASSTYQSNRNGEFNIQCWLSNF
ncbi:MAG: hypothetical protein AAB456_04200 [Patescibacteria group bacterium]